MTGFNATNHSNDVTDSISNSKAGMSAMNTAVAWFATAAFFFVFACIWCVVWGKIKARYSGSRRSNEPQPVETSRRNHQQQSAQLKDFKRQEERKMDLMESFNRHNVQMVRMAVEDSTLHLSKS